MPTKVGAPGDVPAKASASGKGAVQCSGLPDYEELAVEDLFSYLKPQHIETGCFFSHRNVYVLLVG